MSGARNRAGAIAMALTLGASIFLIVACTSSGRRPSANDAIREGIEDTGVDPSSALSYEHYFLFGDASSARDAERELIDGGFEVRLLPPADGVLSWSLTATQRVALTARQLDLLTEQMTEFAKRHGGTYDGWGTLIG